MKDSIRISFFLHVSFLLLPLLYLLDSVFVTLLRQFCRAYNSLTKFFFWKRKRLFLIRYIYTHEGHGNIFISQRLRISGEEDFLLHAHTPSRPRARYLARRSSKERKEGSSRFNPPSSPCLSKRCPTTRLERVVRLENKKKNRDPKTREISVSPTRVCISMHTPRGILIGMR